MKTIEEQRAYQLGYVTAIRKDWFERNGPCVQCGSSEDLELDHIDPEEKVTHRVWSLCAEKRNAELAKCQVLCHRCHMEKTRAQFTKPLVHGTANGYKGKGCRCDACRKWNADSHRERRYRRKEVAGAGHDPATSAL